MTYHNWQEHHKGRTEGSKEIQQSTHLAKTIFNQWLLQQLRSRVYTSGWGKQREETAGALVTAIQTLERAATWDLRVQCSAKA
jgi:hypothetical protein